MDTLPVDRSAVQRRAVAVLSAAQVLGGLGVAVGVAVSGLIASDLGHTDAAGGLAQTFGVLGAGIAAVPLGRLSRRHGRRAGLAAGMATGAVGAAVVVAASAMRSLPLMLFGLLLFGAATAAGLQARYGATDLAAPERAARALSIVVWATTIGSVLGPNLSEPAGRLGSLAGLPPLVGPFLVAMICFAAATFVLLVLLRPDPLRIAQRELGTTTIGKKAGFLAALKEIAARPRALTGLVAVASSHVAMVSVMVMTPVHMNHGEVTLTVIGLVISVHIVGMYAFSPLTGWLADQLGRTPVIVGGAVLTAVAGVVSGAAPSDGLVQLGLGLFLLGLGWSCGIVAGSALLSESVPAASRTSAQGASDLVMNGAAAIGGSLAGVVVARISYAWLGFGVAVLMAAVAVAQSVAARRSASTVK